MKDSREMRLGVSPSSDGLLKPLAAAFGKARTSLADFIITGGWRHQ